MSYSQKIPNACQHSACSMGRRAGRLACVRRALRLPTLGWAAWRGVGGGGCQQGGFHPEIGSGGFFAIRGRDPLPCRREFGTQIPVQHESGFALPSRRRSGWPDGHGVRSSKFWGWSPFGLAEEPADEVLTSQCARCRSCACYRDSRCPGSLASGQADPHDCSLSGGRRDGRFCPYRGAGDW